MSKCGSGNEKEVNVIHRVIKMGEVLLEMPYFFYFHASAWMEAVSHGLRNVRRVYSKISDLISQMQIPLGS